MTGIPRAHSKYNHIFVVVRLHLWEGVSLDHCFTLTKAYADYEMALREADRLNDVNRGKQCRYVVHLARMVSSAE